MKLRVTRLFPLALVAVLVAACTPGGGSIYYTLENEVKVEDGSLPNAITVFDVAKVGTDYYAAAGKIWTAPDSATSFPVDVTLAPPHAGDLCTALAAFGTELYGGFINGSGNLGLYATTSLAFSTTPVADGDVLGAQVSLLKVENGQLAVVTVRPSGPDFVYTVATGNGTVFGELPIMTPRVTADTLVPIYDVIYSTSLAAWFVTEGTTLYTDSGTVTTAGITAGEVLTGLYDDGTTAWVASKAGAVYWWDAAALPSPKWQRIEAPTVSTAHPPLTRFAGPVGTGAILLIGSDGYGYYRLPTSPAIGSLTRFPTTTIDLYSASVRKLVVDGTRAFALTSMGGLWRGAVDGAGEITWSVE